MRNKKECCGCTACFHICPINCIVMKEDEEGFLYPNIDKAKCIHCNKCKEVCPNRNIENRNTRTQTFVGYYKDDEVRKQSSSGGIFSAIAEWILQQKGVVFGAAFDENFEVHHIAVETKEELIKLRGSKYVQSRLENTFLEAKEYLEKKRKVLFTGTACQIAGLKNYLSAEYENLYTVDVLCHGAPSPKIWRMYLDDKKEQYQASINKVEFRNKDDGWKNFSINIAFSNMERFYTHHNKEKFMRMFLDNLDLRPSCYSCVFKEIPRISDVTIGDSWGVENYMPDMDDDKGTSVILVHSSNGEKIFQEIRKNLIVNEVGLDVAVSPTADSRKSVTMHPNRNKYLEGVKRGENFDVLYEYVKKSFLQRAVGYVQYFINNLRKK
ncbi:MAG: Coenzyme F420 hydrogenase/dehydrogenase, beta subunit C-terminal domain [Anaerobutyricum hallii]|uniref:Coenzyme F420 hydrogenase/dehydrogenase, beta subunit C-terminal domain n=1 Tax=Anaerobutyricum hallii TaxID=39488 RepID=UPI002A7EC70D|nr:Coenzyme F420 hydrogenase/dehydrogenase, beta subunit C-terminal domain [Anaerobutyricum hallii]MDY4576843.1 Coenzyme F420 hydrogenase/dehydrogenase, beta subunit C-terminal domain [Anaerobutyricum hallii]